MTSNPVRLISTVVAAAILIAIGVLFVLPIFQTEEAPAVVEEVMESASDITEMQMGNPDASVTVIEYASYTCPHCANFHTGPLQQIKTDYVDTNKINFIYREVYFDKFGLWASMVARCDPSKFFGISDMLYQDLRGWTAGTPVEIANNLATIGKVAGLSDEQLQACLSDADKAQKLNEWFEANATRDGISSTPSFLINGEVYSNMNYADFAAILDEKLGE